MESFLNDLEQSLLDNLPISNNHCFICGLELSDDTRSEEHIYPKWLQNKFNLWNQQLTLLNNTTIRYKDLKVPCCKTCNQRMNTVLEKPIEQAVVGGYDEITKIHRDIIFLWLSKLAYGVLYKELSLLVNRSNPLLGSIVKEEGFRKEERIQFLFLQTVLSDRSFMDTSPYSMLFFRIAHDECDPYWASENPFTHTFFMRMNDIGIIANLMDNRSNERIFLESPETKELLNEELLPIQFAELCARFQYKSGLFNRDPFYMFFFGDNGRVESAYSHPLSGVGYDDWSQEQYAHVLAFFLHPWGLNFDDLYSDDGRVLSLLWNEDFSFKKDLLFNH